MIENCDIQDPQEGGGIQEEIAAQTQEVEQKQINEQQETQEQVEQQQEQTQQEQVEPIPVKVMKMLRYLPPAFQIYMPNGWVVKVVIDDHKAINCSAYKSRSGLTWHGCYHYVNGEFQDARGLYIVEAPELDITSRAKLTRDITSLEEYILNTLKVYGLSEQKLISYNNWGFNVFDIYKKAPTLQFEQVMRQGHLYVFRVPQPYIEGMEETDKITIYNHEVRFSRRIKATQLNDEGTGVVYLLYVPELVAIKSTSPDHSEENASLSRGWYLAVHQRPLNKAD